MKYAMALACLGTLLLSAPALAGSSHGHTTSTMSLNTQDSRGGDQDRENLARLLDQEVDGVLHNPHCDPDDRDGPDGDRDDHAANNRGREHEGDRHGHDRDRDRDDRCVGHPASP